MENQNHDPFEKYFQAGGTLAPNTPSYVNRPADDQLYNAIIARKFAYVLTARQMGKSSLMARTAYRLKQINYQTVTVDLTHIGIVPVDQWYLGFLLEINNQLKLNIKVANWWGKNRQFSPFQRFSNFLKNEVLKRIDEPLVLFVDEIDSTLSLDFSDDFFAGIRSIYNARAREKELERLVFVLVGVATPTDLMKDNKRTPFNIGVSINLKEFRDKDRKAIDALKTGLEKAHPKQGNKIFDRIFYWTDGHPYLTQNLCQKIYEDHSEKLWDQKAVDLLVQNIYFEQFNLTDDSIEFTNDRIVQHSSKERLLRLYRKVVRARNVRDDSLSELQSQLKIAGLVKEENGYLAIPNNIYRKVFDIQWINKNLPLFHRVEPNVLVGSLVGLTILASLIIGYFYICPGGDCSNEPIDNTPTNPTPTPTTEGDPEIVTSPLTPTSTNTATLTATPIVVLTNTPTNIPIPTITSIPTATLTPLSTSSNTPSPTVTATPPILPLEIISTATLNLRVRPQTDSSTIKTVQPNTKLMMVGKNIDATWVLLGSEDGFDGFVLASEVDLASSDLDGLPTFSNSRFGRVIDNVTIYQDAESDDSKRVGVATAGTIIEIIGRSKNGSWFFIKFVKDEELIEGFAGQRFIDWSNRLDGNDEDVLFDDVQTLTILD
ncbi:MAG: AAA-like domain-containing protein [Bacteroidota bacterium]